MNEQVEAFVDPLSGVLTPATLAELERADAETRERIGQLYRALRPVQQGLAELRGPVAVPPARHRTETQSRAVRCPRCSHRYFVDGEAITGQADA